MLNIILISIFPIFMAFAAISDLFTMRISNRLVMSLAVLFFPIAIWTSLSWGAFGLHLMAGAIVLAVAFGLFALGWIGGGDAKFAAAIALWMGGWETLVFVLTMAIWGGALTLLILAFRQFVLPPRLATTPWIAKLHDAKTGIPYGIAMAAAGLMTYSQTEIFIALAR